MPGSHLLDSRIPREVEASAGASLDPLKRRFQEYQPLTPLADPWLNQGYDLAMRRSPAGGLGWGWRGDRSLGVRRR